MENFLNTTLRNIAWFKQTYEHKELDMKPPPPPPAQPVAPPHDASLDEVERTMIAQALNKHNGRRKAAAVQLGISERTLYRKIKEYGLD